jgi:hypothetical protein
MKEGINASVNQYLFRNNKKQLIHRQKFAIKGHRYFFQKLNSSPNIAIKGNRYLFRNNNSLSKKCNQRPS